MYIYLLFLAFFTFLPIENGNSSLISFGKKLDTGQTYTLEKARKLVATWRQRVARGNGRPDTILAPINTVEADRRIIKQTLKISGLDKELEKSLRQIKILLNLSEIRTLTSDVAKAKGAFSSTFAEYTRGNPAERRYNRGGTFTKDRYYAMAKRLSVLLNFFSDLIKRYPTLSTNTPDLLVGMNETLNKGRDAYNTLLRYIECFKKPDQAYCTDLAQEGGQNARGEYDDESSSYEDQEYDDEDEFY